MPETKTVPQFVNADMNIGEVVMRYPVTADIMLSYGLHCVGCHVNAFESIRQGAVGHGGMDDEEIVELVEEMNEAIAEREQLFDSDSPLVVTRRAMEKIADFANDEKDKDGMFLRVKVIAGGCSGLTYDLDWDRSANDDDTIVKTDNYDLRVDPQSLELIHGSVLDYVDGLRGSGFKIDNPNATQQCGCGHSFS